MGRWETKGFFPTTTAQTNNRADLQAVITVPPPFVQEMPLHSKREGGGGGGAREPSLSLSQLYRKIRY